MHIYTALSHSVSARATKMEFAIFFTKSVAMATSLEISKKDIQIDHLHPKCFHLPVDPEKICLREIIKKED